MRLTVSGDVSPDCTIADTGEPAGEYNGQPYWSWTNEAGTWHLWYAIGSLRWHITTLTLPGEIIGRNDPHFSTRPEVIELFSDYLASGDAIGTAAVAEYVAPAYAVLTINDGPLAGQYIVLRKS